MTRAISPLVLLLLLVCTIPCSAQEFNRPAQITASGVPYFTFVRAGEPSVQVMVIGSASPGLYEIGTSTRLDQLLTLAGGVGSTGEGSGLKGTSVVLYRSDGGQRHRLYESTLEALITEPVTDLEFKDGDVLMIQVQSQREPFARRALPYLQSMLSVASLVLQLAFLASR